MITSMSQLEPKHYAILAALLVAVGTQLMAMQNWAAAFTPVFIGGLLMQVGTTIAALFVGAPAKPYDGTQQRRQSDKGVDV